MLLPALGMQAGSEMRSGEDGRTQMQKTIGNVRSDRLRQNLLCSSTVKRWFARVWNGWLVWRNEPLQQIV